MRRSAAAKEGAKPVSERSSLAGKVERASIRLAKTTPEEKGVLLATVLSGGAALWLTIAWADPLVLLTLPCLALASGLFLWRVRRRTDEDGAQDWSF
jgi:hypothetical protein